MPEPIDDAVTRSRRRHRAARIEDWFHGVRSRFARARGQVPTIIPYTGYGGQSETGGWARVLCRVLLTHPRRADRGRPGQGIRGWRSFISVPVGDVPVEVEIGGITSTVYADRGGVVDTRVSADLPPGRHTAILRTKGAQPVEADLVVVASDARFGIVSDVDDTVMVTALPRPLVAAWNTFVVDEHARTPIPGMAVLYERLIRRHPGAPIVYLSTGAWNVAPAINRFLDRNLFPEGPLLLTDWGPTHDRWFRSGVAHKSENLRRLAAEFPGVRWLLIGDDGQHDDAIYSRFAEEQPDRVAGIAIRQLSSGEAVLAGGRSTPANRDGGVVRVTGPDGSRLADALVEHDLL
ncbi:App1 family protein [Agromyces seonyuensis]|uniref:DUF2183 domain-containing protein n=1 Tax=Agromyces seonyuensis TaxID=2662446 RepID=A0A6I4NZL0_9MICO|nr:phosphatase domain-containing protein [Agromyces seonyuensis]MWB98672.1 DUF2183 domain-containing protein [Agromyces seonyuensis]